MKPNNGIYGCIGETLKHSFSKEIHNALADYDYRIIEIPKDKLLAFATEREFRAINVTIPYKELIMPYMDKIDSHAEAIGAVNTVVNREGKLFGYNTDFYGMSALIKRLEISLSGRKVIILGTGGTSKTARAVAKAMGARETVRVSREAREDAVDYDALYKYHTDAEVIINTTPVGMYPKIFDSPVRLECFPSLIGAVDAVYNPLRTPFVLSAKERGISAEGGLYMLVAQGVRASEIFLDTEYPEGTLDSVYSKIAREKENIVLIGMPASGKSTVGALLANALGRPLVDTDALIAERCGKPISDVFSDEGEAYFREVEAEVVREVSAMTGAVIATGGGAVLRADSVRALRENGRLYFIDRPPQSLIPTSDRPTASTREAIEHRYSERYEIYTKAADVRVDADALPKDVMDKILSDFEVIR